MQGDMVLVLTGILANFLHCVFSASIPVHGFSSEAFASPYRASRPDGLGRRESHRKAKIDQTVHKDDGTSIYGWDWEEAMRKMATVALVPVLYHSQDTASATAMIDSNLNNAEAVSPEKALKQVLRLYQKNIEMHGNAHSTREKRQASRKRLSELILGTSVMRVRHYYTLLARRMHEQNGENFMDELLKPFNTSIPAVIMEDLEPIIGVHLDVDMMIGSTGKQLNNDLQAVQASTSARQTSREKTTRALVDLHAEHLLSQNNQAYDGNAAFLNYYNFRSATERISILYSLPIFFVRMLLEQYGSSKTEEMAATFNRPGPITIRRNSIKCPSDRLLCERLQREDDVMTMSLSTNTLANIHFNDNQLSTTTTFPNGCIRLVVNHEWSPSKKSIWSMSAWRDGWFEVQDAGSQLIVEATEVTSGDIVIDYCAGNGGKTFALASQMYQGSGSQNSGYIIAHDIVEARLRRLQGSFERIGLCGEALNPSSQTAISPGTHVKTTLDEGIELYNNMADVVLVDAPCSSTGVLRRRPSQRFVLQEDEIMKRFPPLQAEILVRASKLVNDNGKGRLVYATCSICRHENEEVVGLFESLADFSTDWERWNFEEGKAFNSSAGNKSNGHYRTLLPSQDSDGFFMCRWKRRRKT